jgi:Icc-related predicted phosphoesterase
MVKILVIGDFHGKFPKKLKDIIKKEKINLVVSTGDYSQFSLGKLFFKHVYGKEDVELWEFIGKERYKQRVLKDHKKGKEVLDKLNNLSIPVISVLGNHDYSRADDVMDIKKPKKFWKWSWDESLKISKEMVKRKNIHKIDYNYFKWKDLIFVGARGHSFPGLVKSKAYKKHRAKLEKIFKKFNKENREGKIIFVAHVPPYKTNLDLIKSKEAHEKAKNKHFGSKMFKRLINRYQPSLFLCGHVEESKGKEKIGNTLAVNCGSIHHGDFFIIDFDEKKGKIRKAVSKKIK